MKITLGFCYRSTSPTQFIVSVINSITFWDEIIMEPYRHSLADARNSMVEKFLDTDSDALMMVDTDMVFTNDDIRKLVELDVPIAAGCYMNNFEQLDAAVRLPDGTLHLINASPLPDTPRPVDFAGGGFMLVKREVFETLVDCWFDEPITIDKDWKLEDWDFCWTASCAGYEIILHPGVQVGHMKMVTINVGNNIEA